MGAKSARGPLTVLVTGAGAPPGVSILKAFRQSGLGPRLVATDADPLSVGLFRADAAYVLPRIAEDEVGYLCRLKEICRAERVVLVCPGSEGELARLAPHREQLECTTGARLLVNGPRALEILMDKWRLVTALRELDLPAPDTALGRDPDGIGALLSRHGFPVIVKPRHGSGSRHLHLVRDAEALRAVLHLVPEPVVQEYLVPDDQEYSVGVYRSPRLGYVGQIIFWRTLSAGLTYKAVVVRDPEIEAVCRRVVDGFGLEGPVNVQLRKTAAGARIFEVNPRFSSSAVMRAGFGFNEAELCLRDLILGEEVTAPTIRPGAALRFWDELYLSPDEQERMGSGERASVPGPSGSRIRDF
ncbi:MAG TPA: ATP-grasp domain-containing protein [Anaeromyxobacter sp.]|nr:ATP-grasp domain-containing protein [Anaeromyxobacter sp.]